MARRVPCPGSLTEPGRSSALGITSPGREAAFALIGAARRLGVTATTRQVRGADHVVVRNGDAIAALLTPLGAHLRASLATPDAPPGPNHGQTSPRLHGAPAPHPAE